MTTDRDILDAALREDLACFIEKAFGTVDGSTYLANWHIEAIAHQLQQAYRGEVKRLIITMPPRSLKSICASVAFPAWVLGRDPTRKIIAASYSQDLTNKHARDCRAVMESPWYAGAFPETRISATKNTEAEFETTKRGFRLGTSVGGTLTGRGGNLIIIDDPLKADDALSETERGRVNQWFDNVLYSRLDNKARDVIVIVMQRLHVDDLVGHVMSKEDWTVLDIPAIAEQNQRYQLSADRAQLRQAGAVLHPEREPREALDKLRSNLGTDIFLAQYQQTPVPPGGGMIKWDWFRFYDVPLERSQGTYLTQSWDTASKASELSSWSVCTTWLAKGNDHYLLDLCRERLDYPDLKRRVAAEAERWKPNAVLIEDKGSGIQLIQELRKDGRIQPVAIKPEGDKILRASAQSAKIEGGHVFLPCEAPWLEAFKTEVIQFPQGRWNDQVDSQSQYLGWAASRRMAEARIVIAESQAARNIGYHLGWPGGGPWDGW